MSVFLVSRLWLTWSGYRTGHLKRQAKRWEAWVKMLLLTILDFTWLRLRQVLSLCSQYVRHLVTWSFNMYMTRTFSILGFNLTYWVVMFWWTYSVDKTFSLPNIWCLMLWKTDRSCWGTHSRTSKVQAKSCPRWLRRMLNLLRGVPNWAWGTLHLCSKLSPLLGINKH